MSDIKTRGALKTLVTTNFPSGTGAIAAADLREWANAITESALLLLEAGEADYIVINMTTTTPPGSPGDGDAYVVGTSATGAWVAQDGKVAIWDATESPAAWNFVAPTDGMSVWNLADDKQYRWDAGASPAVWAEVTTGGGTSSYDVPVVFGGVPAAGEVIARYTMVRTIDFAANFAGSVGTVETVPDATFAIDIRVKDDTVSPATDTSIGTVSISTAGIYTFTTAGGSAKQITPGQKFEAIAPSDSPAEASIDGISFMLLGIEG